ncbi:MAG: hypothetical protein M3Z21_05650 [Pseudomonadota bacterium]|nr:hypothetical protein [Pseudomonadota bacterium]
MTETTWRFDPLDTWFFRESRPHGTISGSELESLFPPPVRTLCGAVRTLIGDLSGANWTAFRDNPDPDLKARIGHGDDLGPLSFKGPWLTRLNNGGVQRLYPVPAFLLASGQDDKRRLHRLRPGDPVECDLGRGVRLPVLEKDERGAKPLEGVWLTAAGLKAVLQGRLPEPADVVEEKLYDDEPRLGIARDNRRRTAQEQMLYQTRHLRLRDQVAVELDVAGAALTPVSGSTVRLGGEGRVALVSGRATPKLPSISSTDGATGLILCLMTPADPVDPGKKPEDLRKSPLLPGFRKVEESSPTVWRGEINGVSLTCHCAVIGKPRREGGWDLVRRGPRPVRSLIPAGSAWFCTVDGNDLSRAIDALHGTQIGTEQKLGRGILAVGLWNDDYKEKQS